MSKGEKKIKKFSLGRITLEPSKVKQSLLQQLCEERKLNAWEEELRFLRDLRQTAAIRDAPAAIKWPSRKRAGQLPGVCGSRHC